MKYKGNNLISHCFPLLSTCLANLTEHGKDKHKKNNITLHGDEDNNYKNIELPISEKKYISFSRTLKLMLNFLNVFII